MKDLGIAADFPAVSVDVCIAQYDVEARSLKPDAIDRLSFA